MLLQSKSSFRTLTLYRAPTRHLSVINKKVVDMLLNMYNNKYMYIIKEVLK